MKRIAIVVAVFLLLGFILTVVNRPRFIHEAGGRFLMRQHPTNEVYMTREPQLTAISNFLCEPSTVSELADVTKINPSEVRFLGFQFIRNTSLICVTYEGRNATNTLCVASNAAVLAVRFCSTNRSDLEVYVVDAYIEHRRPQWDRFLDVMKRAFED